MSREQTQNKIYFNANISLRQQGKRAVSSLDQGNPAAGLPILSECLLVPPLVRDLQRKVMVDGAAHRRGCLLVNRVDTNRGDILHYRMISSTFLHRHHRNHERHLPGVRLRSPPSASATLATCVPERVRVTQ